MAETDMTLNKLKLLVYGRLIFFLPFYGVIFFLPAGTINYWQAWVYLGIFFLPAIVVSFYLLKKDPELLKRRMRLKEKEKEQKLILNLSYVLFVFIFLIPGLNQRFNWSRVPAWAVITADIIILISYLFSFWVFRVNSYASRIIEVEKDQKVISTGPYALVRHPMYLGVILMYLPSPVALGSFWALVPAVLIIPLLVARIINEEKVLFRDLQGYGEYQQKVRYRLIPGFW